MSQNFTIFGFPCELTESLVRAAVHDVLQTIHDKHADDFLWLQQYLVKIVPHPSPEPGVQGECKTVYEYMTSDERLSSYDPNADFKKVVLLVESAIESDVARGLIAHELGHVASGDHQNTRAHELITNSEEWASESLADLYVMKWGFKEELRVMEATRDKRHHRLTIDDLLPFVDDFSAWREMSRIVNQ